MPDKIIISGATGLIGKKLTFELLHRNYKVFVLTRDIKKAESVFNLSGNIEFIDWGKANADNLSAIFESAKSVINLSGESLGGKRWNTEFKKKLYSSRINITRLIVDAIKKCRIKPESFICSSAVGYYGTSDNLEFDETSPPGNDFLANLCKDWESTALKAKQNNVRTVCVRTGIVLDKNEGALKKLILPFRLFLGGKQGGGKQWVSWVHINDVAEIIILSIEKTNIETAINATSPDAITNEDYCKAIGKILHRPVYITLPGFMLKLLIGEFANYVLTGQKVLPSKALKYGYKFQFDNIDNALKDILNQK